MGEIMAESLMAESFFGEEIRKDFEAEQDARMTAWGETPQPRWVDHWLDSFALLAFFCGEKRNMRSDFPL
jgi:hypothetical protein